MLEKLNKVDQVSPQASDHVQTKVSKIIKTINLNFDYATENQHPL